MEMWRRFRHLAHSPNRKFGGDTPSLPKFDRGVIDLTRPDVSTLFDETQGGFTRQTAKNATRAPCLSDAIRIIDVLKYPTGAKFDGGKAHRMAIAPGCERGLVSIMVPNGLCSTRIQSVLPEWFLRGETGTVSRARLTAGSLNYLEIEQYPYYYFRTTHSPGGK